MVASLSVVISLEPLQNDDSVRDPVDAMEVFDLIRDIKDPEHEDLSLESLNVLQVRACWLPWASRIRPSAFGGKMLLGSGEEMLNWREMRSEGWKRRIGMKHRMAQRLAARSDICDQPFAVSMASSFGFVPRRS